MRQKTWFQDWEGVRIDAEKCSRGCLALEGAANGRRPEVFRPSARAEALGKASKVPRLILNQDLL